MPSRGPTYAVAMSFLIAYDGSADANRLGRPFVRRQHRRHCLGGVPRSSRARARARPRISTESQCAVRSVGAGTRRRRRGTRACRGASGQTRVVEQRESIARTILEEAGGCRRRAGRGGDPAGSSRSCSGACPEPCNTPGCPYAPSAARRPRTAPAVDTPFLSPASERRGTSAEDLGSRPPA